MVISTSFFQTIYFEGSEVVEWFEGQTRTVRLLRVVGSNPPSRMKSVALGLMIPAIPGQGGFRKFRFKVGGLLVIPSGRTKSNTH